MANNLNEKEYFRAVNHFMKIMKRPRAVYIGWDSFPPSVVFEDGIEGVERFFKALYLKEGYSRFVTRGATSFEIMAVEAILNLKKTHPKIEIEVTENPMLFSPIIIDYK